MISFVITLLPAKIIIYTTLNLEKQGWRIWSFKTSGSRKILVEIHGSRSLVFLAVMCVLQSRFLYEGVSESRFFPRVLKFPDSFVCLF